MDNLEKMFLESIKDITNKDSAEILNFYRNFYYTQNENTERGIVAWAINNILPKYIKQEEELKKLRTKIAKFTKVLKEENNK